MRRTIVVILALAATISWLAVPATALADGDPASDVLLAAPAFVPADAGATPRQLADLDALVTAVSRRGFPLRVAIIASSADLGTVTQDWEDAEGYAGYLYRELSLVFHGNLLIVMPEHYGLVVPQKTPPAADDVVNDLPVPGSATVTAAIDAVERLAASHHIPVSTADVRVAAVRAAGGSSLPVLVFLAGLLAVAAAWAASLRARPLRTRVAA